MSLPVGTGRTGLDRAVHGVALAVAACVVVSLSWTLSGGTLFTMSTPSMCPTVCLGALVADRPLVGPVHPGELITFFPPGSTTTYTHRVVAVTSRGITTKGDGETAPDPWILRRAQISGRVVFTWWGAGWLLRALPFLAVGMAALIGLEATVRPRYRNSLRLVWLTAMAIVPVWVLDPFVRADLVQTEASARGPWATALVVNTGLLPARFSVKGGQFRAPVPPSRPVLLSGPRLPGGALVVHQAPSLSWWGWLALVLLLASPLLAFVVRTALGYRRERSRG
ncbi:MAG: S24/S26 family peptidase [Acidimicrobiales bacterium]